MKRQSILVLFVFGVVGIANASFFNDGGTHTVYDTIDDWLEIEDGPGGKTTHVDFVTGARVTGHFSIWDTSEVRVYDGIFDTGFISYDSTATTVYNGFVGSAGYYFNYQSQRVPFSILSEAQVDIYDGFVSADIVARLSSLVSIYGGELNGNIDVGTGGRVMIYGQDFTLDGSPIGYVTLGSYNSGHLAGTLANGDSFNCDFGIGSGSIELLPIPSAVILGGLGLTFSGWLLKRKRMM